MVLGPIGQLRMFFLSYGKYRTILTSGRPTLASLYLIGKGRLAKSNMTNLFLRFLIVMTYVTLDIQQGISCVLLAAESLGLILIWFTMPMTLGFFQKQQGVKWIIMSHRAHFQRYGLKLNEGKCVAIAMNNDGDIHFEDRTLLLKKLEAHTLEMKTTKRSIYS